jgi:hypothetical protein
VVHLWNADILKLRRGNDEAFFCRIADAKHDTAGRESWGELLDDESLKLVVDTRR